MYFIYCNCFLNFIITMKLDGERERLTLVFRIFFFFHNDERGEGTNMTILPDQELTK